MNIIEEIKLGAPDRIAAAQHWTELYAVKAQEEAAMQGWQHIDTLAEDSYYTGTWAVGEIPKINGKTDPDGRPLWFWIDGSDRMTWFKIFNEANRASSDTVYKLQTPDGKIFEFVNL